MILKLTGAAVLMAGSVMTVAHAEDWPQFRGPGGGAVSGDQSAPSEWGPNKNIAWKVTIPGYGWSCPVVVGNKIFVTTAVSEKQRKPTGQFGPMGGGGFPKEGGGQGGFPRGGPGGFSKGPPDDVYKWELHCLDATDGKVLWKQTAAERKPVISTNPTNGYATETPAADSERVYAYFGGIGKLFCYDHAGKSLWTADIGAHSTQMGHGTASSPVVADGRVFVQCDNEEKSFLMAVEAATGKELWRISRTERTSWTSPVVWQTGNQSQVVCVGSSTIRAYDPATGKQLWELKGLSGQPKSSPVVADGLLFVGSPGGFGGPGGGFGRPGGGPGGGGPGGGGGGGGRPGMGGGGSRMLLAIKSAATGDITPKASDKATDAVAWKLSNAGPATASLLAYQGCLYVADDRGGMLSCYDAKTGKEQYKERIPGSRNFISSPWACGGKVFLLDDAGTTHVLKAGPEFEVLGSNKLGEMCWSSPAIASGAVYLRTVDHLFCIRAAK